ncbi:MAG: Nif3-like dinuclear metal center hexameric protein [Bacteroidales bacterium]|nr:Nif3-like dinuclear metal center hexameric protein [Bacteroidales bacterium]
MMKINDVIRYLDEVFHPEYQEEYDNAGFLLGDGGADYRGAMVALDLTPTVIDEALTAGDVNLIVTHHPFIFKGVRRLTDNDATGRMVNTLIRNGIAVYAAHTNLDNLSWGVNGALCERLGVHNCRILKPSVGDDIGAGMVGELDADVPMDDFLLGVKQQLGIACIRYAGTPGTVRRVAVCGGSGSFLIDDALAAGADIFLTADLKYHDFQRATDHMALADLGHYESEQFAKETIYRAILKKFSNFACRISEKQGSLVSYI